MSKGMAGLKNTAAKHRSQDGGKLAEGAASVWWDTSAFFALYFFTMTWNLMCHWINSNIVNGDSMSIQFTHTQTDMSRVRAWHKSHIFANPEMPKICPILSLARYRAAFPRSQKEAIFWAVRSTVDSGRFIKNHILPEDAAAIQRLGIESKDSIGVQQSARGLLSTAATTAARQLASPFLPFVCGLEGPYLM
jgi:hypothetical protein